MQRSKEIKRDQSLHLSNIQLETHKIYEVFITHVSSNGSFDAILKESEQLLQEIANNLNKPETYANLEPLRENDLFIGNYCAAKWDAKLGGDDMYYRAQIINKNKFGNLEVRFIDYGNLVEVSKSELVVLRKDVQNFPAQGSD